MVMAPILMGDYVTVNGIFLEDDLFAVYNLLNNIGLYTMTGIARKFRPADIVMI
jgi:hypothetical protein